MESLENLQAHTKAARRQRLYLLLETDFCPILECLMVMEAIIIYNLDESFLLLVFRMGLSLCCSIAGPETIIEYFDMYFQMTLAQVEPPMSVNFTRSLFGFPIVPYIQIEGNNQNIEEGPIMETVKDRMHMMYTCVLFLYISFLLLANLIFMSFHIFGSIPLVDISKVSILLSGTPLNLEFDYNREKEIIVNGIRNYINNTTEIAIKSYEYKSNYIIGGVLLNFIGELKSYTKTKVIMLDLMLLLLQLILVLTHTSNAATQKYTETTDTLTLPEEEGEADSNTELTPLVSSSHRHGTHSQHHQNAQDGSMGDLLIADVPLVSKLSIGELRQCLRGV